MKILQIIKSVNPAGGGPIEGAIQQSQGLMAYGVTSEMVCLDSPDAPFVKSFPFPIHALGDAAPVRKTSRLARPLRHYGYHPSFVPWLKAHLKDYDAAIVHGLWNYATFGARQALVGGQVPYVVFCHGMLDPWFKKQFPVKAMAKQVSWLLSEGPLLNNAALALFTTEEERVVARNVFLPYRLREHIVSYGTGDAPGNAEEQKVAFRTSLPALGDRPYLLFLSRIHPKKGCDLLLKAYATVAAQDETIDLVMAGPDRAGWLPELTALTRRLGIDARVHWPGMLQGDVKWGAIRGAEAFVLPSHQENFGVAVVEAMAAGRPVLFTNKVNIWREIESSGSGLIEDDSVEGITRLLERFLAMPAELRLAMGRAGRDYFLAHYEVGHVVRNLHDVFTRIVDAPADRGS